MQHDHSCLLSVDIVTDQSEKLTIINKCNQQHQIIIAGEQWLSVNKRWYVNAMMRRTRSSWSSWQHHATGMRCLDLYSLSLFFFICSRVNTWRRNTITFNGVMFTWHVLLLIAPSPGGTNVMFRKLPSSRYYAPFDMFSLSISRYSRSKFGILGALGIPKMGEYTSGTHLPLCKISRQSVAS